MHRIYIKGEPCQILTSRRVRARSSPVSLLWEPAPGADVNRLSRDRSTTAYLYVEIYLVLVGAKLPELSFLYTPVGE